jgi:hypothetical protein
MQMCKKVEMLSVEQLISSGKVFEVAYYQRGYRWRKQQVTQLLDDLCNFIKTHKHPFYFMQALVVNETRDNKWRIVDGQQRLTTIKLILEEILPNDKNIKMEYKREEGGALDTYFQNEAKKVIEAYPPIKGAIDKLKKNIKESQFEAIDKLEKNIKECQFLVYNLGKVDEAEEESVFNRLNSGKIPAKESELIKCVMLTPQPDEPEHITTARAQEWDDIERELSNDAFFYFMATKKTPYINDRMAHLLHIAGITPCEDENERFPMLKRTYEILTGNDSSKSKSREQLWKDIYSTFYTLKAWFIDKDTWKYHAFGWRVHRRGDGLPQNLEIDMEEMKKILNDFKKLKDQQDVFNENKEQAIKILFLFNVAYSWRRGMKYNFAEHANVSTWSLEHIHARNQEKLNKDDFDMMCKLECTEKESNLKYTDYEEACTDKDPKGYQWLEEKIENYPVKEDHSLKNLALLPRDDNSSLNNCFFKAKRKKVISIKWLKHWIPDATRDVFAKSLPGLNFNTSYWGEDDRKAYVEFIGKTIQEFQGANKC